MDIVVYTDGACSNNGKKSAKAGIGVYFGEGDPRNISERITGKQTNNAAELTAILRAVESLAAHVAEDRRICICSDSEYAIRCCTTYGDKLAKKHWKLKKQIPNLELVRRTYNLCKSLPAISFKHIRAHTGLQDEDSLGNEGADRLANQAIGCVSCPYEDRRVRRIYLRVPYSEKDEAKVLGAKWDPRKKRWYIGSDHRQPALLLDRW